MCGGNVEATMPGGCPYLKLKSSIPRYFQVQVPGTNASPLPSTGDCCPHLSFAGLAGHLYHNAWLFCPIPALLVIVVVSVR